jgi:SHS2 domain-containing protein
MTLLGHKTDIMFRRYIQRHDERLREAAKALAEYRSANSAKTDNRNSNGHNSGAAGPILAEEKDRKYQ